MTANIAGLSVIHPVVMVDVNGRKFRALLDSGASQSYVSSTLNDLIGARVARSGMRRMATLLGVATTKLQEYDLCLRAVKEDFALNTRVTRIDKRELLLLDNPRYAERVANHSHLIGVELEYPSLDRRLPIHIILGANEYEQIRTRTQPRVGRRGEPVAEFTRFDMAPGIEADLNAGFLAVDAVSDYEKLPLFRCSWVSRYISWRPVRSVLGVSRTADPKS